VIHLALAQLEAGLHRVRGAPSDLGRLELIARRPGVDERELLERGALDLIEGLVGDSWIARPSSQSADGGPLVAYLMTVVLLVGGTAGFGLTRPVGVGKVPCTFSPPQLPSRMPRRDCR
jgi:hypothetical protein